jgi:hypothetical protein
VSVRYSQAQAQSLGLIPSPPVRRSRKTHTADGHEIDPAWLWMNEEGRDGFRAEVMKLVRLYGWACAYGDEGELPGLAYHASSAMHQAEKGWPDLTLIRRRDHRLVFAELKRENGELSGRQVAVMGLLRCLEARPLAGGTLAPTVQVAVWRPSDMDAIREILR